MKHTVVFPIVSAVLLAAALSLAGCRSPEEPRDLMAEEARMGKTERPIAMKGEGVYADGSVNVVATVARGLIRIGSNGAARTGTVQHRKNHWYSKHETEAYKEDNTFDYSSDDEEQQKEAIEAYIRQEMARRAAGSPMPPVTLDVVIENRGKEPIEVVPVDVNSDLGNFAARPEKLTVAPGEKGALDPMISQLGVTSDDIPLTLTLRVGGKKETQVIHIRNVLDASTANPPGAPTK